MPPIRDFRSLADRVEVDFHHRGNRFSRRVWWWSAGLGLLALLACCVPMVRGHHAFYAAGTVSTAHQMFEHDCVQCHQDWTLLARLNPFSGAKISSVKNEQCLACHPGELHHPNQIPLHGDAHAELSCADCHREHRGNEQLASLTDSLCQQCHLDLKNHGGSQRFALEIDRFDNAGSGGHPEFALDRLLKRDGQRGQGSEALAGVWRTYTSQPRDRAHPDDRGLREVNGQFVDRGRIQFNHQVHLAETLLGPNRKPLAGADVANFRENCQACHEPDDNGRYMRPIRYERHCQSCHPLTFDAARFPGEEVPHVEPNTVLGWLLQRYAQTEPGGSSAEVASHPRVLGDKLPDQPADNVGANEQLTDPLAREALEEAEELFRELPGPLLPETTTREVQGGCKYCHHVVATPASGVAFEVIPPQIPERWWLHAEFDHSSHTMLTCHQCHGRRDAEGHTEPVSKSSRTEDVLLPGIDNCRQCHVESPNPPAGVSSAHWNGAGHRCVECHVYHEPPDPEWTPGDSAADPRSSSSDPSASKRLAPTRSPTRPRNWKPSSRFSESSP